MSKPGVILVGAGGHAHACIDVIEQHRQFQIGGLVGMQEEMHTQHLGYAVIATDAELPQLAKDYQYAFIAVGQIRSPDRRIRLYQQAIQFDFSLPGIIAPTAHVSCHATIGAGSFVGSGCVIKDGITLGKSCLVGMGLCVRPNQADHFRFIGDDIS